MSGGGGNQTNTTKFEPPPWTAGLFPEYVNRGAEIAGRYATDPSIIWGNSPGQEIAIPMSPLQVEAAGGIRGMAVNGTQGQALGSEYLTNLLNGKQQNIQPSNEYMGNSPQFEAMLAAQNKGITDNFARGTAAQQDASAARAGAFGGSADTELKGVLGKQLADSIAQNEAAQRNAQWERSAGLRENEIGRGWQGWENAAGRQMQGVGLLQNADEQKMRQWMGLMGVGDLERQLQVENMDARRNLHNQNVQQPINALDLLGSVLQRASGQGGSQTTTFGGGGQSPWMNALGLGLGAYSMWPR